MLEVKNLLKTYGAKKAVDNASFVVKNGELCAFIGKNGAGKTTAIKCICGIIDFDDGEILINGKNIKTETIEAKKNIAYIPDNPSLYDFMTGIEYLNFVSDIYGVSKENRKDRINHYALLFEIKDNLGQEISSYSHGMKQKLAIISALIHSPKLIVLDEPFVGLDPSSTHQLKNIMKDLTKLGTSIFFSTHILEVAEKLCDNVIILNDGKVVASGTMKDVLGNQSLENIFLELSENE